MKKIASILLFLNSYTICFGQFEYFPPEYSTSVDSFLLVWKNLKTDSIKFIITNGFGNENDTLQFLFENKMLKGKINEYGGIEAFYSKDKKIYLYTFEFQSIDNEQLTFKSRHNFTNIKGKKPSKTIRSSMIINRNEIKKVNYVVDNKLAQKQANKMNAILFLVVYPLIAVTAYLLKGK